MSGFTFDDLQDLDEGANDKAAPVGSVFDSLDDLDAQGAGFKPYAGPEQVPLKQESSAGKPQWSGGSTLGDAAYSAAGGVVKGIGVNPRQAFGDEVGGRLQIANERSPIAAPIGNFIGETAIQAAAAPAALARAPAAMGALSGLLSGVGNSEGGVPEKVRAGVGGAAGGAYAGHVLGSSAGSLGSLLERKGAQWAENQATHGLMNRGAGPADLARLDELGGRQQFYDDANRLGIKGKAAEAAPAARQVASDAEAARAEIEARNANVQVDPNAAAAAVRGANPYPGVTRMDRAADRAANQVQAAGPGLPAMDTQRAYYGNSQNFASGTPNARLGQGVHGAINGEIEDAMNLANPGDGSAWRQAGRDERAGLELGGIAQKAADTQRAAPWTPGEVATGGLSRLINNNRNGIAESVYGAGKGVADVAGAVGRVGAGAPAAAGGNLAGGYSADQSRENTQQLTEGALNALHAGGQQLGRYRDDIAQAASSPAPGALGVLLTKLAMTDPEFRQTLLPLLRQQGGM